MGLTDPGITMIIVRAMMRMIKGLMQEGISLRGRLIEAEPTVMVTIETVRVEAGPSSLAPSASVGPSVQLTSQLLIGDGDQQVHTRIQARNVAG